MNRPAVRTTTTTRRRLPQTAAILLAAAAILLFSGCRNMIVYHPANDDEEVLLETAARKGLEPWPEAGEDRIGWYAPPPAPRSEQETQHRVLIFHGNGGQSVKRDHFASGFQGPQSMDSWEVYILEYPGYGSRPGKPSERALVSAAQDAVDRLIEADPSRPVYLVGESLGTAVASIVASEYPDAVPAVLLITPFTNIVDVGATMFPRFFVRAVLRDRYDSEAALAEYSGRVGVLLAGEDDLVTTELGQELYDGYHGEKRLWIQEEAGHNTLDYSPDSPWWREVTAFLLGGEASR